MSSFGLLTAEALLEIGRPAQAREHAAGYLAGHPEDARGLRLIGPLSLATGMLLIFLPMGAFWPGDVPDLAEGAVLVILGGLLLGYAWRVPVTGTRWLWRRLRPAAGRLRLRPAAGRPAP